MSKYFIAHDIGTSGNKSIMYGEDGQQIYKTFMPYDTFYPDKDYSEQRPNDWLNAVKDSTRKILAETTINKKDIKFISFSGQSMGVVPVDKNGNLLKDNVPIWNDSRAIVESKEILNIIDEKSWYKITGAAFRPENHSVSKISWYKKKDSDIFNKTHNFLPTKNYIIMKLTGKFFSDYTDASFSGMFDISNLTYWADFLNEIGIPQEKLPKLCPSTEIIGELIPSKAEELGLDEKTLVVSGGVDNSCAALGAGNIFENRIYNSIGSSAWISITTKKPVFSETAKVPCYVHVVPDLYLSQVSTFAAGATYKWVKEVFCKEFSIAGEILDKNSYTLMNEEAAKAPAGSNRMIFNPSFMGGSTINPNPFIKGAFLGLNLSHKKSDLLRSVMEGITFDQALALEEYRKMNFKIDEMRVVGGGSNSSLWRQIMADIFNCRIIYMDIGQEAAAFGAGAIGAVATNMWKDFSVVDQINRVIDIKEPKPNVVKNYQKMLPVYKSINDSLISIGKVIKNL